MRALRRGERVLTESTLRGLLLAGLVLGFALRIVGWDDGDEGLVAWVGGIMALVSLAGLIALGFFSERRRARNPSFFFDPSWKYRLALACIASLVVAGAVDFGGVVTSLCAALFWLALIALVVQTLGRWILRWRDRGSGAQPLA